MKSSANYSSKMQPATIALIGFAYFVIAVVALYFLNPAYNLLRSFAGNYDLGSYEFLIASTFFSLGLGSLALVIGLYQGMPQSVRSLLGLVFLGIWGVGMLIAGIFPVKVEAYPETTYSYIHILALIGSLVSLSLATILLSWRFKQDEKWRPFYRLALILALVMIAASISFCSVLFFPALLGHSGLISPVIFIVIGMVIGLLWLFLTATRLRHIVTGRFSAK